MCFSKCIDWFLSLKAQSELLYLFYGLVLKINDFFSCSWILMDHICQKLQLTFTFLDVHTHFSPTIRVSFSHQNISRYLPNWGDFFLLKVIKSSHFFATSELESLSTKNATSPFGKRLSWYSNSSSCISTTDWNSSINVLKWRLIIFLMAIWWIILWFYPLDWKVDKPNERQSSIIFLLLANFKFVIL